MQQIKTFFSYFKNKDIFFIILIIVLLENNVNADISTKEYINNKIDKSWKSFRDSKVIKQDKDFSCGAASIATILSEYYQQPTTENEVLKALEREKYKASFADMEKALPKLGFKGLGLATSWKTLTSLKIPVVLYVRQRKQDHFTVVSGISDTHIKLSDSSLGNKILTRGQFKEIWETRKEKGLEGKMLAILPLDKNQKVDTSFFSVPKISRVPTEILTIRDKF